MSVIHDLQEYIIISLQKIEITLLHINKNVDVFNTNLNRMQGLLNEQHKELKSIILRIEKINPHFSTISEKNKNIKKIISDFYQISGNILKKIDAGILFL